MFIGLDDQKVRQTFAADAKVLIDRATTSRVIGTSTSGVGIKTVKFMSGDTVYERFLKPLMDLFKTHFARNGHPVPALNFNWKADSGSTIALFSNSDWTVAVNPKLAPLDKDWQVRMAYVTARSIYHEMRHAEQYCLAIRYAWYITPDTNAAAPVTPEALIRRSLTPPTGAPPKPSVVATLKLNRFVTEADQRVAKAGAATISTLDYEFAGRLYSSLFRSTVEFYLAEIVKGADPLKKLLVDETTATNLYSNWAADYTDAVIAEIKVWNANAPTKVPPGIDVWISVGGLHPGITLRETAVYAPAFLKNFRDYLLARRQTALNYTKMAQDAYLDVLIEKDAHATDTAFKTDFYPKGREDASVLAGVGITANKIPEPVMRVPPVPSQLAKRPLPNLPKNF
jgi:hypothetical protein